MGVYTSLPSVPFSLVLLGPKLLHGTDDASAAGNMSSHWVVVGMSEKIAFRGLIRTYLMKNLEGYVGMGGHDLCTGMVTGAVFWGRFRFVDMLYMPAGGVVFRVTARTRSGRGYAAVAGGGQ